MKEKVKSFLQRESNYLSRSVLLKENYNPKVSKFSISFSAFVFVSFFIWTAIMDIDEVALAPGEIIPLDNIVKIQHIDGGIVKKVHVKDGQGVNKDEIILELDEKRIKSKLDQAKLQNKSLQAKLENLKEQIKIKESLYNKGLNSKLSFLNVDFQRKDLEGKISENNEVINRLTLQLDNLTIHSPIGGFVHNVTAKTTGQVIESGKTLMEIIPGERKLMAEIQISPDDIGHVRTGQEVSIKFNTFDFSRYGGITAKLQSISPFSLTSANGRRFFKGEILLEKSFINHGSEKLKISPGMTLISEIKTGRKTLLTYLLKPLYMKAEGAFKEK